MTERRRRRNGKRKLRQKDGYITSDKIFLRILMFAKTAVANLFHTKLARTKRASKIDIEIYIFRFKL